MVAARTRRSDSYETSGTAWNETGSSIAKLKNIFRLLESSDYIIFYKNYDCRLKYESDDVANFSNYQIFYTN